MSMNPTGNETYATPFERALVANENYFAVADDSTWFGPSFYSARDEEEVMSNVRGASVYDPYPHFQHEIDAEAAFTAARAAHFYEVRGSFIFGVAERRCHFNHDEDCGV
jgi:hypothetical protein